MERLIEYLLLHFKLENSIAPVLALIIAVMDNKSKGVKDCIIVSILATGVAGVVQDYLPAHSIWTSKTSRSKKKTYEIPKEKRFKKIF